MTDEKISIGKFSKPHGIRGNIKITATGTVLSELKPEFTVFLKHKSGYTALAVTSVKTVKLTDTINEFIVKIKDCDTPEAAEKFRGMEMFIEKNKLPHPGQNEFYQFELIGLSPKYNGEIQQNYVLTSVMNNPAHQILIFSDEEKEILIPFISQFVGDIDPEKKTIEIYNWDDWLAV